ncbi:hypothetical protein LTR93_010767 [Exophiala xenobiotica]|nr:hypothetical protein LTR93_010767 [Exophiala xenobiotica]
MRTLLQRPSFLLFANNRYSNDFTKAAVTASSNVCVKAAQETIGLIKSHYDRYMLNSLWYKSHYIFTSVGVLATVQTLEPSRRSLLSSIDLATIENGIQFLRSARYDSVLASHYITLLQKSKNPPISGTQRLLSSGCQEEEIMAESENEAQTRSTNRDCTQSLLAEGIVQSGYVPVIRQDEHDLPSLDAFDPFFGFGLSQGFTTTDWT